VFEQNFQTHCFGVRRETRDFRAVILKILTVHLVPVKVVDEVQLSFSCLNFFYGMISITEF
jgi:hypothetical protein